MTRRERHDAEALVARFNVRYEDIAATLEVALDILQRDLSEVYARSDDTVRRLMNQAIFAALWVSDEEVVAAELAEPFASLRTLSTVLGSAARPVRGAAGGHPGHEKGTAASPASRTAALVIGSINGKWWALLGSNQ